MRLRPHESPGSASLNQSFAAGRLLDDGYLHRALHRDLDLLVLDGVRRWGNGRMLPMGDLREPQDTAKRAQALVVTRGSRAPKEEIEGWWKHHGSGGRGFPGLARGYSGIIMPSLPGSCG